MSSRRPNFPPAVTSGLGLAAIVLVLLCASGCGSRAPAQTGKSGEAKVLPVLKTELLAVQPRTWPTAVRTQGSLIADEVAVVGAKVAGRVAIVHVDLGDVVKAGQPLVSLDQAEFQFQVSQTESQLQQAYAAVGLSIGADPSKLNPENAPPVRQEKALWNEAIADLRRMEQLRSQNAITASELDQVRAAERVAEARYDSALNSVQEKIALIGVRTAELALARQQLDDSVIVAPFDGVVQQRHVAPGMYAQVGDPMVTIVRTNPLRYRGAMPERHAHMLALGQEVRLQIESRPEPRKVTITRISPSLDEMSRALVFEADIDNSDGQLRTGLFAEADVILRPDAKAITVPKSAVTEFAGVEKVWKVVDGVARETVVLTGARRANQIEIVEGVAEGDLILFSGNEGKVAKIEATRIRTSSELDADWALGSNSQAAETGPDSESSE